MQVMKEERCGVKLGVKYLYIIVNMEQGKNNSLYNFLEIV